MQQRSGSVCLSHNSSKQIPQKRSITFKDQKQKNPYQTPEKKSAKRADSHCLTESKTLGNPHTKENAILRPLLGTYKNAEFYVLTSQQQDATYQIVKEIRGVTYDSELNK